MESTKCDRWRIDSAGVECGSKMLGTGLSCGAAIHNPVARRTPARRTRIPATRPTIAPQSALCIVAPILIEHPLQELKLTSSCKEQLPLTTQDRRASEPSKAVSSQLQGKAKSQAA